MAEVEVVESESFFFSFCQNTFSFTSVFSFSLSRLKPALAPPSVPPSSLLATPPTRRPSCRTTTWKVRVCGRIAAEEDAGESEERKREGIEDRSMARFSSSFSLSHCSLSPSPLHPTLPHRLRFRVLGRGGRRRRRRPRERLLQLER